MPELLHVTCPQCDGVNRLPAQRLRERPSCGRCKQPLFNGHPVPLSEKNFETHVVRSDIPVVVDFWAPWCGPCRTMAPVFEQAAQLLEPGVRLAKLNTEEAPGVSGRFNIRSIPTLVAFRGGREVARQSGAMAGGPLMAWIRQHAA